ncbi:MAG: hypothetical protein JWM41_1920 [Gemmatimonadetes bacterium]|nr:hypothetical protein [Gemmatimonadota bacterium]
MEMPTNVMPVVKAAARLAMVIGSLGALAGCASIPQRAWANGQAMSSSRAFQAVQSGDQSIDAHRRLQGTLNPRLLNYREVAYPAFGTWW